MLVPMTKERFVSRMLRDARERELVEKEKKRRLRFVIADYKAVIIYKKIRQQAKQRYYR